jgi:hypothetical protein
LRRATESLNARISYLDPAESVLSIKLTGQGKKILAVFAISGAFAAVMPRHVTAQSSRLSTTPAPSQSGVQVPTQAASAPQTAEQQPQVVQRTVTVTFDYDFTKYPPCSAKVAKKCIQQFNVWEVSDPAKQLFLFTIPVPPDAQGMVKGITGTAPKKRAFFAGPHRFGVSAKTPEPEPRGESDPRLCMAFAQVLPDNPASPASAPNNSSPHK